MTTEKLPVVVGIDATSGADAALDWALAEARSRAVPVRLVHALGRELAYGALQVYGEMPPPDVTSAHDAAASLLTRTANRARVLAPDVAVTTHVGDDGPIRTLLEESTRASTIVLGTRHLGTLGSVTLGSVGTAVSARASCPVVVLRGPAGLVEERAGVVVGVDAQEPSDPILAYAFDFAHRRALPLHAVLCWRPDVLAEMLWRPEQPAPEWADLWLSEALAGWRPNHPDVEVHASVVRERPVAGLLAASAAQQLLVVGTRGRHAVAGALLGSVSQGVLTGATCPVAVVPLLAGATVRRRSGSRVSPVAGRR